MIAIIDYGAGNIQSVQNAFNRLGAETLLTSDAKVLQSADKVIFPGVGEAQYAMQKLKESGLESVIPELKQPVFGICLGMQLMCASSEEGNTQGLGIFKEHVLAFPAEDRIPHMGWNNFSELTSNPILKGISLEDDVYFAHSYYAEVGDHTQAQVNYIKPFSAALNRDNFYGVQFHPEKSAQVGEQILKNFLAL